MPKIKCHGPFCLLTRTIGKFGEPTLSTRKSYVCTTYHENKCSFNKLIVKSKGPLTPKVAKDFGEIKNEASVIWCGNFKYQVSGPEEQSAWGKDLWMQKVKFE